MARQTEDAATVALMCADSHIFDVTWRNQPAIAGDAFFSLAQVLKVRSDLNVPLLAAGDFFDVKQVEPHTLAYVQHMIEATNQDQNRLLYIQGQHDMKKLPWLGVGHSLEGDFNTSYMGRGHNWFNGHIEVAALDWQPSDRLTEALKSIKFEQDTDIRILMLHQVTTAFMGNLGGELQPGMLPEWDVPPTHILIGDYHDTCTGTITDVAGKEYDLYSPGSFSMQSISEPHEKHFYHMDEAGDVLQEQLVTRPYLQVKIHRDMTEGQVEDLVDCLAVDLKALGDDRQEQIKACREDMRSVYGSFDRCVGAIAFDLEKAWDTLHTPLLHVRVAPEHSELMKQRVDVLAKSDLCHPFWKVLDGDQKDDVVTAAKEEISSFSMPQVLAEEYDSLDADVFSMVDSLVSGEDPQEVVNRIRNRQLSKTE